MKIKRVLQGTALTALAAVAWAGVGTTDAAAADVPAVDKFPVESVKFNLDGYESRKNDKARPVDVSMRITVPKGSKEIMVGVASFKNGAVKIADTAWEVHDVAEYDDGDGDVYYDDVLVNLSKLSVTKDNYIAVKSDSTKPIFFRINASITKLKFNYNAGNNNISIPTFTQGANASALNQDNTTVMYRTQTGPWSYVDCYNYEYDNDDNEIQKFNANNKVFQEYQYQGATLYLRVAGEESDLSEQSNKLTSIKDANDKSTTPAEYDLYNAGYMPSKEVKLNIAKQANGPSVSANYVTGEVKIPNNTEYRVIASGGAFDNDGTDSTKAYSKGSGSNVKVADLLKFATGATSGTIEVRKTAVTTGKGKVASKWTRVSIEIPDPIDVTGATQKGVAVEGELNKDTVISVTAGAITLKDKTTIEATTNNKTKAVNGVKVTVPTDCKYGVVVTVGSKTVTVKNDGKAKTIKATAGAEVKIHKAGDKKTKAWANDASQDKVIGKVQ